MKTIDHTPGPDEVLDSVVGPDGKTKVRVRRPVVFLTSPIGNAISTVSTPANGETFTALKGDVVEAERSSDQQTPSGAAEKPMSKKPDEMTSAEKASAFDGLWAAMKGLFVGGGAVRATPSLTVDAALKAIESLRPAPATKMGGDSTSVPEQLAVDAWHDQWSDLWWAFDDVVWTICCHDEVEGDRPALLKQALADFSGRAMALIATRPATKSADAEAVAAAFKAATAAAAAMPRSQKAGKVMAARNVERLKAALAALSAMHEEAMPPPPAPAVPPEAEPTAQKADFPPAKPKDGAAPTAPKPPAVAPVATTPKKTPDDESAKESDEMNDTEKQALAEKIAAIKAAAGATPAPALKSAIDELEGALKGAAPAPAAGAPGVLTLEAVKGEIASWGTGLETRLTAALKAIAGMDVPGDEDPVGDGIAPDVRSPTTPEEAAQNPSVNERGVAPIALGAGPAIPGSTQLSLGQPTMKAAGDSALHAQLEEMRQEIRALKGARPAPQGFSAGPATNGTNAGGWSGDLFVED